MTTFNTKRRSFLKKSAAASASAALLSTAFGTKAFASTADSWNGKTVVVIFQPGGNDGLNTVIPFRESQYLALRPNIGIDINDLHEPNGRKIQPEELILKLANGTDSDFALNPHIRSWQQIWNQGVGDLAIFPSVGYPNANRSHFVAQKLVQIANHGSADDRRGWLNHHLSASGVGREDKLRAVSWGGGLAHAHRGDVPVSLMGGLNALSLPTAHPSVTAYHAHKTQGQRLLGIFREMYNGDSFHLNLERAHDSGTRALDLARASDGVDFNAFAPETSRYTDDRSSGTLKNIAKLLKADRAHGGIFQIDSVATSLEGWDDHKGQGGAEITGGHSRRLARFTGAVHAFYEDLKNHGIGDDVLILTATEFGRTLSENGALGTEHGTGGAWFALGGGVRGGIYNGARGTAGHDLSKSVQQGGSLEGFSNDFLSPTVDYRLILEQISLRRLDNWATAQWLRDAMNRAYASSNTPKVPLGDNYVNFLS